MRLAFQELQGHAADQRQVVGGTQVAHAELIFREADIQTLMQIIFHPPMLVDGVVVRAKAPIAFHPSTLQSWAAMTLKRMLSKGG